MRRNEGMGGIASIGHATRSPGHVRHLGAFAALVLAAITPGNAAAVPGQTAQISSWMTTAVAHAPNLAGLAAVTDLAALAGALFALAFMAAAERRMREFDRVSQASLTTGVKLLEGAARRLMQTQDDHRQEVHDSATIAGEAGARLIGAAREVEARWRSCVAETELRLREAGEAMQLHQNAMSDLPGAFATLQAEVVQANVAVLETGAARVDEALQPAFVATRTLQEAASTMICAAEVMRPVMAQCVAVTETAAGAQRYLEASRALFAKVEGVLGRIESASQAASAWPPLTDALAEAAKSLRDPEYLREAHAGAAFGEARQAVAAILAGLAAQDRLAERLEEAAFRVSEAAECVAASRAAGVAAIPGACSGLLSQIHALHAQAVLLVSASQTIAGGPIPTGVADAAARISVDVTAAIDGLQRTAARLRHIGITPRPLLSASVSTGGG